MEYLITFLEGVISFISPWLVFCLMGLFAGTIGRFLVRYRIALNIVTGLIVIFFGLVFMDVIPLPFLRGIRVRWKVTGLFSAFCTGLTCRIYSRKRCTLKRLLPSSTQA